MLEDIQNLSDEKLLLEMFFNQVPHAMILVDLSEVKQVLSRLIQDNGDERKTIYQANPSILEEIVFKINVKKFNKHVWDFIPVIKEQLPKQDLFKHFLTYQPDLMKEILISICVEEFGGKEFQKKNKEIISYSINPLPEYEKTLKSVIITVALQDTTIVKEIKKAKKNYKLLFDEAPIGLWEEDFSRVENFFDELRRKGVSNFREHFDKYPEDVKKCSKLVEILDVNQATLDLYKAQSKEMLLGGLDKIISERSFQELKEELIQLEAGKKQIKINTEIIDFKHDAHHLEVSLTVLSTDHDNPLSRVIVSTNDITELKEVELELKESKID